MADTYEKDLGAKSSLTTSDYVRVVGTDNVSYKQTVSNVMKTMGVSGANIYGALADFYSEFSSMATNTKYFTTTYGDCSTALGLPSGTYKGYVTKSSATLCDMTVQSYVASGNNLEYIGRVTFNSSGSVTASNWTAQPTKAEIDEATTKTSASLTAGTNITLSSSFNSIATKKNGVVTIEFALTSTADIAGSSTVATVPSGYRPSKEIRSVCYFTDGYIRYGIQPSGSIITYSSLASGKSMLGTMTYIV